MTARPGRRVATRIGATARVPYPVRYPAADTLRVPRSRGGSSHTYVSFPCIGSNASFVRDNRARRVTAVIRCRGSVEIINQRPTARDAGGVASAPVERMGSCEGGTAMATARPSLI